MSRTWDRVKVHGRDAGIASVQPSVLIIVENLPVPFDRRVWLECQALRDEGYNVSVVCPKGDGDPRYEVIDKVEIFKYRSHPAGRRKVTFITEYVHSFSMTAWLTAVAWRRNRFDVIQTCNPPDIFWPIGLYFAVFHRVRFVFDQHDLCPELYLSRFPDGAKLPYRMLRLLEWCTYRTADQVISTNGSYRATALDRGGKKANEVTVVRTGPDPEYLKRAQEVSSLKRGRPFLVCYLGVMGPQDGVDIILRAAAHVRHQMNRNDISFTLMGKGDCFDDLLHLREHLDLVDVVEFTGRAPDELVSQVLSTADIGLSPDPWNPLNDVSTMNKTMEYMAFELPVVAFDLKETRVSAEGAAVYVEPTDVVKYAEAIVELIDDAPKRRSMGLLGRARVEEKLAWRHQRENYLSVYASLIGSERLPFDASPAQTNGG